MSQQPFEMHKSPSLASAPPPTIAVKATQVNVTKIIMKQDLSFSLQQIGFGFNNWFWLFLAKVWSLRKRLMLAHLKIWTSLKSNNITTNSEQIHLFPLFLSTPIPDEAQSRALPMVLRLEKKSNWGDFEPQDGMSAHQSPKLSGKITKGLSHQIYSGKHFFFVLVRTHTKVQCGTEMWSKACKRPKRPCCCFNDELCGTTSLVANRVLYKEQ